METSGALAALRCLPCVVGSFADSEGARRDAIERPLSLIEELLAVCSAVESATATAAAKKRNLAAAGDGPGGSGSGRKRGKIKGGRVETSVEGESGRGGGEGGAKGGGGDDEVAVLCAYALEAGVGLCCLLPAGNQSAKGARGETLERLLRWHER